MVLTELQVENNKNEFLQLLSEIDIPGADTQALYEFLAVNGDFFTAPASTNFHLNCVGGLCQHSLNVYHTLVELYEKYKHLLPREYDKNTLLVCGLFHDISKVNFYEQYFQNKKIYNEQGTKKDNMGKFDWVSVEAFKVKDATERFLAGNHEENSMLILGRFIPLMQEEMIAILNHHGGLGHKDDNWDLTPTTNKYSLLALLHMADYISTFILERE